MTKSVIGAGIKTLTAILPDSLKPDGEMFKWTKHNIGPNSTITDPAIKAFITRIVKYGEDYSDIESCAVRAFSAAGYSVRAETLQVSTGAVCLRVYFLA